MQPSGRWMQITISLSDILMHKHPISLRPLQTLTELETSQCEKIDDIVYSVPNNLSACVWVC